nr:MAG TPA: hypothetical protein [Caudoviricetes sp.]
MARFDDDEKKNNAAEEIKEVTTDETKGVKLIANGTYTDITGEKYYAGEEMLVTEEEAKELLKIGLAYVPEQPEKKGRNRK